MTKVGTGYIDIEGNFAPLHRQLTQLRTTINRDFRGAGNDIDRGLAPGLNRTSQRTRTTQRDVDGLGVSLRGLGRQSSGAAGGLGIFGRAADAAKPAALITAVGIASQALSAAAGAAVAAGAALAPLAGLGAAAGGGFMAAAQGAGVFKLATLGIGDALKEQINQQSAAGGAATSSASSQRAAAAAIQSAEDGVRSAHQSVRDALLKSRDAQAALSQARIDARRYLADLRSEVDDAVISEQAATFALKDANAELSALSAGPTAREVADAHLRVGDALRGEQRAVLDLTDAHERLENLLKPADALDVADARDAIADAARAEQRAAVDLTAQRLKTAAIEKDATKTDDEKQQARLDLADAENRIGDARRASARAAQRLKDLEATPDAAAIARARLDISDAEDAVTKSKEDSADASKALADIEKSDRTDEIAKALLNVTQAEKALHDAKRDRGRLESELADLEDRGVARAPEVIAARRDLATANRDVRDAEREVVRAEQALADAQAAATEKMAGGAAAAANLNQKLNDLPAPAQEFVRTLLQLKPRFDELRNVAASGFFPGATDGLLAAVNNFGAVRTVVADTAGVLGDLARQAGELLGSAGWGRDLETIGKRNAGVIRTVGTAALNAADALRHILIAAGPLTTWLADLVGGWAKTINAQAAAGRESGKLAGFFEQTRAVTERLLSIAGSLGTALWNIGKAAAPLGREILAALDTAAKGLADWTGSLTGKNALRDYFDQARAPIFELGRLISDVTHTFFRLGSGDQVAPLLHQIRTELLPVFETVIDSTTRAFGPHLITALTQVVRLFGSLAGSSGPLTQYVDMIGRVAGGLADLLEKNPQLQSLVVTMIGFATVLKAVKLAGFVTGFTALGGAVTATAGAYGALASGTTLATVAQERGVAATIAAKVAQIASAAATRVAAAAQAAYAAVTSALNGARAIELGLITATTIAVIRQRVALVAGAVATKAAAAAQWLLNAAMTANPIGLVVVALGALVAGLVIAYQKSETFRNIVNGVFEWLKTAATTAFGIVKTAAEYGLLGPVGLIITRWDELVGFIKGAWGAIKDAAGKTFAAVATAIRDTAGAIGDAARFVIDGAITAIKSYVGAYVAVGKFIINRVVDGVRGMADALANAAGWVKNRIVDGLQAARGAFVTVGSWVTNRVGDGIKTVTTVLGGVGGWIKNRIVDFVQNEADGFRIVGSWVTNRIADGFKVVTEALSSVGGWIKNRIFDAAESVKDGFMSIGGSIVSWIVKGLKDDAKKLVDFLGDIVDLVNKVIPGTKFDLPKIKGLAQGGTVQPGGQVDTTAFARGGVHAGQRLTAPIVLMGEDAPAHPEYVIPTNPAYRDRAVALYARLGSELGVGTRALAEGGINGGPLASAAGFLGNAFGWVKDKIAGVMGVNLPSPKGLGWVQPTGEYIAGQIGDWIKDKIGGVLKIGVNLLGLTDSNAPDRITRMVDLMDRIDARGWDYKYGGGHGSFDGPYDCSGLVSAILHAGGFIGSTMTTDGLKVFGEEGDGKAITIGVRGSTGRQAHTMMKLGNRYLESGSGHGAKWVSGWSGGFPIHRHPEGYAQGGILAADVSERLAGELADKLGWGLAKGGVVSGPFVGTFHTGGVVPHDGLANVQAGETIHPAGYQPEINVYIGGEKIDERVDVRIVENGRRQGAMMRAGVLA